MSERVNIQYSVSLEELEPELARLLDDALSQLASLSENNARVPTGLLSLSVREQLDSVRQSLASIDARIGEVNAMIEPKCFGRKHKHNLWCANSDKIPQ